MCGPTTSASGGVERAGIAMETVSCPYQDTPSRFGGKMNLSAYEALRHDVADILNGFAWLAEHDRAAEPQGDRSVQATQAGHGVQATQAGHGVQATAGAPGR